MRSALGTHSCFLRRFCAEKDGGRPHEEGGTRVLRVPRSRSWWILFSSVCALLALAASMAGAQEPTPQVDAEAERLLREMSTTLQKAQRFALEAEELFDEIPDVGPRRQLVNVRYIVMERPDRAVADVTGEIANRTVWFDKGRLAVLDKEQNAYATLQAPPTVHAMLDWAAAEYGIEVPLADLFYPDLYATLMEGVIRGEYLGLQKAAGVPCHHLAFEQETIDWQIWIDAAEPRLPRKLAIAYKTEPGEPQYVVVIQKWNLSPTFPEGLFDFEPPEDAEKMELARVLGAEPQPEPPPENPEKKKKEEKEQ